MGDVEQLRIDLDKFCSTEENTQNKFENIPSKSKYSKFLEAFFSFLDQIIYKWDNTFIYSNSRNSFD